MMTGRGNRALVLAAAVAICAGGGSVAAASWSGSRASVQAVSSGAFTAPTDVAVSATAGSGLVTIAWKASTFSGSRGVGYVVQRHPSSATSPSAGAPTACTLAAAAVALGTSRSCNDTTGTAGSSYKYSVRPVISSWSGAAQGLSGTVTFPSAQSTPPSVTVSIVGASFNNAQQWTGNGCSGGVCGTVTSGSGTLTAFTVQHKRVFDGATAYWNGSAWVSSDVNVSSDQVVRSGSAWSFVLSYTQLEDGTSGGVGNPDAHHALTVTATNSAGKITSVTRTFTSK